jgi:hypothetical protein
MPNILPLMTSMDQTTLTHVFVYFSMDGIEKLRKPTHRFIYNPNPIVTKFDGEEFLRVFNIEEDDLEIKVGERKRIICFMFKMFTILVPALAP